MKKGLKITLIVVGALFALFLLVNFLAGPIAKSYIEKHSKELCNRVATVDKIRVNLFNGSVAIYKLNIRELDNKSSFLYFNKLKVNMSLSKLLGKTVRITEIDLDGLDAKVIQKGSAFNFDDILAVYKSDDTTQKDTTSSWTIDLRNIGIHNSNISYRDAEVGSHFGLNNIALMIPRLYFSGHNTDIGLDFNLDEGGKLAVKMLYDMEKGKYNLNVKMSKFQINAIQPYLKESFNVSNLKGTLTANVSVVGSLEHIMNLTAGGNISLDNFSVDNLDNTPLVSFRSFKVDVSNADLQNNDYQLNDVALNGLKFNYDVYANNTTLDRLFKNNATSKDTTASAVDTVKSAPLKYLIKNLSVTNGEVVYSDYSLTPRTMTFPVSQINISAHNLTNGCQSPVSVKAKLGESGTLDCSGKVDPMNLSNASLDLAIQYLNIKEFSPYALHYLAYPIQDGLLSFSSKNVIIHNLLNSNNKLTIYKPTFGDRVKNLKPAAAKIPMKAAMYIITDRKGYFKMDLPVKGDISSPEFSFRKIIWKTFTNLLVKIAASPIDFLAKIAGNENTFKPTQIMVGSAQLPSETCQQLNDISMVLKEKPQLTLSMQTGVKLPDEVEDADGTIAKQREADVRTMLLNYLASQGIATSRLKVESSDGVKADNGYVKICYNLTMPE